MVGIVFHRAVFCGTMTGLANKPHQESRAVIAGHSETDGVAFAIAGEARTFRGVPEIAEFMEVLARGLRAFMAWGGTMTVPTTA
jgi:hypothetical protein